MEPRPDRHLDWPGCFNARDLGGLPLADGGRTRWGAVVRADALDGLAAEGWRRLVDHGVRTVIDLRNPGEREPDAAPRPDALTTLHLPLDAEEEREFWAVWESGPQFGTPLYYGPHLERFPERSARVLAAIAQAPPGGVAVHCGGGRDRAGQIAMLALALVRVPAGAIAADYGLSATRLRARYAARGEPDQQPVLARYLAQRGTTAEQVVEELVATTDVEARMRAGGLTTGDLRRLTDRLTS